MKIFAIYYSIRSHYLKRGKAVFLAISMLFLPLLLKFRLLWAGKRCKAQKKTGARHSSSVHLPCRLCFRREPSVRRTAFTAGSPAAGRKNAGLLSPAFSQIFRRVTHYIKAPWKTENFQRAFPYLTGIFDGVFLKADSWQFLHIFPLEFNGGMDVAIQRHLHGGMAQNLA